MTVRFSLLGPFHVTCNDQPVTIPISTARALLAWLALESDRPHSRSHIASLIWPDHPSAAASTNLRQALARIRKAFPEPLADTIVNATSSTLQFGIEPGVVDAVRFAELLAGDQAANPRSALGFARREEAIGLYRGELLQGGEFADSQPFDDWLRVRREGFQRAVLNALRLQTAHHRRAGEFDLMLLTASRQVEIDPWRESGHRDVMAALALGGDRAAAIARYHACAALLAHELGISPDRETDVLYEDILHGRLTAEVVDGAGQPGNIGTLRTTAGSRGNRRHAGPVTPLVGRHRERSTIVSALFYEGVRLLTVTGPGGVGKTRLAREVAEAAREYAPDGVWFVPLAALHDPRHVPHALADALDVQISGHTPLVQRIGEAMGNQRALVVLDNFEQVIDAAPIVGQVLAAGPDLRMLVTSREALHIAGERVFRLGPLELPASELPSHDDIVAADAVRLFLARAGEVDPDLEVTPGNSKVIGEICRRLEGLPLTIELAAARLAVLSPESLLERLDHQLPVLADGPRDAPPRQRTMQATLDWSHDLLAEPDRQFFRRLAVFTGGFTIDSAEAVMRAFGESPGAAPAGSAVPRVASLLAKSLVVREEGSRFRLLEVVREYASLRLEEAGETRPCWIAHADALIERFGTREITPFIPDDFAWDAALEAEAFNLQDVLGQLRASGEAARLVRLANIAGWHGFIHGRIAETSDLLRAAMPHRDLLPHQAAAGLAVLQGIVELSAGAIGEATSILTREVRLAVQAGDHLTAAQAQVPLGVEAMMRGAYAESMAYHQSALTAAGHVEDPRMRVAVSSAIRATMGSIAREVGNLELARTCQELAIDGYRQVGGIRGEMLALINLGDAVRDAGEFAPALAWYRQGLSLAHRYGDRRAVVAALQAIGQSAVAMPDWVASAPIILGAAARIRRRYGVSPRLPRPHQPGSDVEEVIRRKIGDRAFDEAWEAGQRLSFDQAVQLAMAVAGA